MSKEINYIEKDLNTDEYFWHWYPNKNLDYLPELEIVETDTINDILLRARMILKMLESENTPFDLITFNLVAETLELEENMAGYFQLWNLIKDYFKISFNSVKCLEALAGTELVEKLNPKRIRKEKAFSVHISFSEEDMYKLL